MLKICPRLNFCRRQSKLHRMSSYMVVHGRTMVVPVRTASYVSFVQRADKMTEKSRAIFSRESSIRTYSSDSRSHRRFLIRPLSHPKIRLWDTTITKPYIYLIRPGSIFFSVHGLGQVLRSKLCRAENK